MPESFACPASLLTACGESGGRGKPRDSNIRIGRSSLKRDAIGIFEIDRPSPSVIDDVGGLYALAAQFVTLLRERRPRPGLEGKMLEAGGNTEPAVDPRIVFCGYIGNSVRFQKGQELTAADIKKHMSQAAAFFDRYRVGDNRLETQHALV
jgi:hypothetical protein